MGSTSEVAVNFGHIIRMSLTKCFVLDCDTNTDLREHHKLYHFPNDPARRRKWLRFCGQASEPNKIHGVCRRHFTEEDFLLSARVLVADQSKWRLQPTALPSLHGPARSGATDTDTEDDEDNEDQLVVHEDEQEIDPKQLCRLCLAPLLDSDEGARNIFDPARDMRAQLKEHFQLVLEDAPNWPPIACGECVASYEQVLLFKRKILTAHCVLHEKIVRRPEPIPEETKTAVFVDMVAECESDLRRKLMLFAQRMHLLDCTKVTCDATSQTFEMCAYHQKTVHRTTPGVLRCCGQDRTMNERTFEHLKYHVYHEQAFCVVCKEDFDGNFAALYDHMYASHRDLPKIPYQCQAADCGEQFFCKTRLVKHLTKHQPKPKIHGCPHCPERFTNRNNAKRHVLRKHDVQCRVVCEQCGRGFSERASYWEHYKKCRVAAGSVVGRAKGRPHKPLQNKPVEEMQDPVKCPDCDLVVDRADMQQHSIVHKTGPRSRFCDICLRRIHHSFETHMARHRGEKFRCQHCNEAEFDDLSSMYSHIRKKHPEHVDLSKRRRID